MINEIFKRSIVDYSKLTSYGFIKQKNTYFYETKILDDFLVKLKIDEYGKISGRIIDLNTRLEYINVNILSQNGPFVTKIRNEYKKILENIKINCFKTNYFIFENSNEITSYIKNVYNDEPEFLWEKYPNFGVFRNKINNKWYAAIMNLDKSKLDKKLKGETEIINLKLSEIEINNLIQKKGYYPAYHMNKKNWITIVLDGTVSITEIIILLDKSYNLIKKQK